MCIGRKSLFAEHIHKLRYLRNIKSERFHFFHLRENILGYTLSNDVSVVHYDYSVSMSRLVHIVRDKNYRYAEILVQLFDSFHNFLSSVRVEHRSRLVHNDAVGAHSDYAGNGNTLLLTARKLVRRMILVFIHIDRAKRIVNTLTHLFLRNAHIFKGESNIFLNDSRNDLIIGVLKNHTDMLANVEKLALVRCIYPVGVDLALVWDKDSVEMLCNCRFSRAVVSENSHKFALFYRH